MKTLVLHGALGERFGREFSLDVATPAEAVRALLVQIKGFRAALEGGEYRVVRGPLDAGLALEADQLALTFGRARELHLVPMPAGSKSSGIGKIVIGVALIAVAFAFVPAIPITGGSIAAGTAGAANFGAVAIGSSITFANVAMFGAGLALAGLAQALSLFGTTDVRLRGRPDERPSYLFNNGPLNVIEQGHPVPLVYGRFFVGSVVVSSGIDVAAWQAEDPEVPPSGKIGLIASLIQSGS
jgi:predicted phage tail protein